MRELRFDSRATDGVRRAERRMRLSVMSCQPKRKLKSREFLGQVISVRKMDISFKITVK